jgi:hypothetical protein
VIGKPDAGSQLGIGRRGSEALGFGPAAQGPEVIQEGDELVVADRETLENEGVAPQSSTVQTCGSLGVPTGTEPATGHIAVVGTQLVCPGQVDRSRLGFSRRNPVPRSLSFHVDGISNLGSPWRTQEQQVAAHGKGHLTEWCDTQRTGELNL